MMITPIPGDRGPAIPLPRFRALRMMGRCFTALVGGYAFAATIATLLARLLPIARVEATVWGMVLSFLIYAVVGLWSFHERRLGRVALVVWGGAVAAGGAAWLLGVRP